MHGADGDFGDGAESYVIAMVAGFFGLIMLIMALAVVFFMEQLTLFMNPAGISLIASVLLYLGMMTWISIVSLFRLGQGHGIACVASLGLYCPIFGFINGKTLLLPAICMLVSLSDADRHEHLRQLLRLRSAIRVNELQDGNFCPSR